MRETIAGRGIGFCLLLVGALISKPILAQGNCAGIVSKVGQCGPSDCLNTGTAMFIKNFCYSGIVATYTISNVYEPGRTTSQSVSVPAQGQVYIGCSVTRCGYATYYNITSNRAPAPPLGGPPPPVTAPKPPPLPPNPCPTGFNYIGKLEERGHDVKRRPHIHVPFPLDPSYEQPAAQVISHGCAAGSVLATQHIPKGIYIIPSGDCFNYGWAVSDPQLDASNDFNMYVYCSPGEDIFNANTICRVTVEVCGKPAVDDDDDDD